MSMLSSYTLLSLAPGKFSPTALQLRRKQPAAASSSSVVALPRAPWKVSRAPRLACRAHTYDILPSALVTHQTGNHGTWKMSDDEDRITLEFNVGKETEEGKLEVATTKDQALLVIRYKGDRSGDDSPAASLDVRLLMPPGYDGSKVMKAEILPNGWLQIIIDKPKQEPVNIKITKQNKG